MCFYYTGSESVYGDVDIEVVRHVAMATVRASSSLYQTILFKIDYCLFKCSRCCECDMLAGGNRFYLSKSSFMLLCVTDKLSVFFLVVQGIIALVASFQIKYVYSGAPVRPSKICG